jgi:hypothetical protein
MVVRLDLALGPVPHDRAGPFTWEQTLYEEGPLKRRARPRAAPAAAP